MVAVSLRSKGRQHETERRAAYGVRAGQSEAPKGGLSEVGSQLLSSLCADEEQHLSDSSDQAQRHSGVFRLGMPQALTGTCYLPLLSEVLA